jgi:hypothetical protein
LGEDESIDYVRGKTDLSKANIERLKQELKTAR